MLIKENAISTSLKGSLWTGNSRNVQSLITLDNIVRQMFMNNEQGFSYDPNDLSTMYQDSAGTLPVTGVGQTVGKILDKSGNGNHALQSTSASRPILRQDATTKAYYLEFDGVDDFLTVPSISFSSTYKLSIFTAIRKLSDASLAVLCELSSSVANTGTFAIQVPASAGGNNIGLSTNGSSLSDAKVSGYASPINLVVSGFADNSASTLANRTKLRINATVPTPVYGGSIGTGNFGTYPLYIGRRAGTSLPFTGHIYSLIVVGRIASTTEIASMERVLAKRIGVTL